MDDKRWEWWVDGSDEGSATKELGASELERLVTVRAWRREAGSWFQSRVEAYWKERSVIRKEDYLDGRASVTKVEERVLRGGWTKDEVMQIWRLGGCQNFVGKWESNWKVLVRAQVILSLQATKCFP